MGDSRPTEQQEDSGARVAGGDFETVGHVRVMFGASSGSVHDVRGRGTVIGRAASGGVSDIQLDDARMSRQHVRFARRAGRWEINDQGSRNGGFVDGQPFRPHATIPVHDGAVIRLGDTLLAFHESPPIHDDRAAWPGFPGVSPGAIAVRRRIDALAGADGHVLVMGETGTGKERVARAIGATRAGRPFVIQNCAELTRDLARSELFGHARGAFSGAIQSKPGLVDLAGDGVLFLDEIGELTPDVQPDLLRFLEDGSYRPVGSTELRHSNARIVAATNVDLDSAVDEAKFRRDLRGRLRASNEPLQLPPLRDRREDIPQWTRLFLREAGQIIDEPWTVGALECVLLYPWLDNLRELRGAMRGLVAEALTTPYATESLPVRVRDHRAALRGASPAFESDAPAPARTPTKDEIEAALRATQGRIKTAAQQLGISRRKLYHLCHRLGVLVDDHRGSADDGDD